MGAGAPNKHTSVAKNVLLTTKRAFHHHHMWYGSAPKTVKRSGEAPHPCRGIGLPCPLRPPTRSKRSARCMHEPALGSSIHLEGIWTPTPQLPHPPPTAAPSPHRHACPPAQCPATWTATTAATRPKNPPVPAGMCALTSCCAVT